MPKLPTAEDLGERPIPRPTRGQLQSGISEFPGAATARAGQTLSQAGDEFHRFQVQEEDRADTLRAEDAHNQLLSRSLDLSSGEDGFKNKKGADAINQPLVKDYTDRFSQASKEIESTLANDRQKAKFRRRAGITSLQYRGDLLSHYGREGEAYAKQVYASAVEVEARNAGAHPFDPNIVSASVERLNAVINERARTEGWDKNTIELERLGALSSLHTAVITSALDSNNIKYAASYFQTVRGEIKQEDASKLEKIITESGLLEGAQVFADEAMAKGLSESDALKLARTELTGEAEKNAIDEIKTRYAEDQRITKEATVAAKSNVMGLIANGVTSRRQIPVAMWNAMSGDDQREVRDYLVTKANGDDIKTNWPVYNRLYTDTTLLAATNLDAMRPQLAEAEFKQLVARKAELGKKGDSGLRTNMQIVNSLLAQAGVDPSPKETNKKANERLGRFWAMLDQRVTKESTQDEIRQEASKLLTEITLDGILWSEPKKPIFDVDADDDVIVPEEDRKEIEALLISKNRPVTPEAIRFWYLEGKRR